MNIVILTGRLVAAPELKYTPNGIPVCTFRLAVRKDKEHTDFFNVVTWRGSAEFVANFMTKGRMIAVNGRLATREWIGQDGTKHRVIEVIGDRVEPLDSPRDAAQPAAAPGITDMPQVAAPALDTADMPQLAMDNDFDPFKDE